MLYPVMTESRMLFDLSGIWTFKTEKEEGEGKHAQWYAAPLEGGCTMPVPASYNDIKTSEELRDYRGTVYYQRKVSVSAPMLPASAVFARTPADTITRSAGNVSPPEIRTPVT